MFDNFTIVIHLMKKSEKCHGVKRQAVTINNLKSFALCVQYCNIFPIPKSLWFIIYGRKKDIFFFVHFYRKDFEITADGWTMVFFSLWFCLEIKEKKKNKFDSTFFNKWNIQIIPKPFKPLFSPPTFHLSHYFGIEFSFFFLDTY